MIKRIFAAQYLKKIPYACSVATIATCIIYTIILLRPLPKYYLPINNTIQKQPLILVQPKNNHRFPTKIAEQQKKEPQNSIKQPTIAEQNKQIPIAQAKQQLPIAKISKPSPLPAQQTQTPAPLPKKQRDIALLNATGKRSEQQPIGTLQAKPNTLETGIKATPIHTAMENNKIKKQPRYPITNTAHQNYRDTTSLKKQTQQPEIKKTSQTTTRARKEGWFRDRQTAEKAEIRDNIIRESKKRNNEAIGDHAQNTYNTGITNNTHYNNDEITIFGKPHDFYRSSLTYVNNNLDENLSILPCTMVPAEPLELEIFTNKVHQALTRHLNQQHIVVYSPQTTTVPISFDLVTQDNTVIAYVVTKSSGNATFDNALAHVMNLLAQSILPPHTDTTSHAIAYPFTYTIHFVQGTHPYHVAETRF